MTGRRPARAGEHPYRRGGLVLGSIAGLIFLVFNGGLPFRGQDGEPVRIEIAEANNVFPGDPVRVAGVEVGYVGDVDLAAGARHAEVVLRITDDELRLAADATAQTRFRSLTGGTRFIELDPGSSGSPLPEAGIPLERTTSQVEFDDLLGIYRGEERRGARAMFATLDRGFDGDGPGATLERIAPAWREGTPALRSLLGDAPGDLRGVVAGSGRVMAALARDEAALARLPEGAAAVLAITAARSGEIEASLNAAPAALAETELTMIRLRSTLDLLDPVAEALRPGVRALAPAAEALEPMLRRLDRTLSAARPTLSRLGPALRELRPAARAGARFFPAFAPTVERLRDELIPFLERRDPNTGLRNYESIGPGLSAAGNATSEFDANGYMLRFQTAGSERTPGSLPCQSLLSDPSADEKLRCDAMGAVLGEIFGGFALEQEAGR